MSISISSSEANSTNQLHVDCTGSSAVHPTIHILQDEDDTCKVNDKDSEISYSNVHATIHSVNDDSLIKNFKHEKITDSSSERDYDDEYFMTYYGSNSDENEEEYDDDLDDSRDLYIINDVSKQDWNGEYSGYMGEERDSKASVTVMMHNDDSGDEISDDVLFGDEKLEEDDSTNFPVQFELRNPAPENDTMQKSPEGTTIIIDVGEMKFEKETNQVTLFQDHFAHQIDFQAGNNTNVLLCRESQANFNNLLLQGNNKTVFINTDIQKNPEKCSICLEEFVNYDAFLFHVKEKHPIEYMESLKLFKCPFCTYYSKNKTSVLQHVRTHTKEKPFKCGVCGKSFNQKAGVQQHMRTHSSEKPYICHLCNGRFKAASSLATHISMRHDRRKPYTCKECGVSFGHSSNLRIHMRIHTGERPYKCMHCDKSFTQQGHLRTHVRLHTGERPFTCDYCNSGFTHIGNLRQHIITQHTKEYPYVCDVCGKGFIAPGDMRRHTKLHVENAI